MKNLLFILLFISGITYGQTWVTKDTTFDGKLARISYVDGYTDSARLFLFVHGIGEVGTGVNNSQVYGFHYWINNGKVPTDFVALGTKYPVFVTLQLATSFPNPSTMKVAVDAIFTRFKVKYKNAAAFGLSRGGGFFNDWVAYKPTTEDYSYANNYFSSIVNMQGMKPDDTYGAAVNTYPAKFGQSFKNSTVSYFGIEQVLDNREVHVIVDNIQDSIGVGTGRTAFFWTNFGGSGHSNFNDMYNPTAQTDWTLTNAEVQASNGGLVNTIPITTGQNFYAWSAGRMLASGSSTPTVNSVVALTATVEKYGKYETAITATATYSNKYNFDAVNVYAIITSPTNLKDTIDGFWMEDFYNYDTTSHNLAPIGTPSFRIRYSPKETGLYVGLVYVKDSTGTSSPTAFNFTATATTSKGFIRKNATNYLNFDDGSTFYAVGQNLAYTTGFLYPDYNKWMDSMNNNNQNLARVWQTSDAFGIEWKNGLALAYAQFEGLKKYEQKRAWAMDWLIGKAERKGIYLMPTQIVHNEYLTSNNGPRWADNPYKTSNGGMCDSTIDFFRKATAIAAFKNRIRYIVARYGYSKQIQAWELTNEINNTDGFYAVASRDSTRYYVREWKRNIADYIKRIDPNKHLVTSSYGGYDYNDHDSLTWHIPSIDFSTWHWYDTAKNPQKLAKEIDTKYLLDFGKPTIQGEAGWSIQQPSGFENIDSNGVQLHNLVWASSFSGAFGTALEWGWDDMIAFRKLNRHYKYISAAMNSFDLKAGVFLPFQASTFGATTQRTLSIVPKGGAFALPVNDTAFTINDVGLLTPKETRLNHFVHGMSANTQYRDPPTFTITYPVAGTFIIDIEFIATGGANINVKVDGVQVYNIPAPIGATIHSIPITAGTHTIRVDNTGLDWFYVREYRFAKAGNPLNTTSLKSADNTKAVGHILNEDYNWKWYKDSVGNPTPATSSNLRLTGMSAGAYTVVFKNTLTNATLSTQTVTAVSSTVEATIPTVSWDMYYTAEKNPTNIITPTIIKIRGLFRRRIK